MLLAKSSVLDVECTFVVKVCLLFGLSFEVTLVSQVLVDVLRTDSLVVTHPWAVGLTCSSGVLYRATSPWNPRHNPCFQTDWLPLPALYMYKKIYIFISQKGQTGVLQASHQQESLHHYSKASATAEQFLLHTFSKIQDLFFHSWTSAVWTTR